jgi:hypothetical protein
MAPHTHRGYAMAGEEGQAATRVEPVDFVAMLPAGGRGRAAAFRRTVVGCAGAALVVAAVLGAAAGERGRDERAVLQATPDGDPSDVAARIISMAKGFNRQYDDLLPHQDPKSPEDTRMEGNYGALAESIVKHGRGIVYRLIHGPPKKATEGIPMPVENPKLRPPDKDGLYAENNGTPPQTTPTPDPSADQGATAEAIIVDSNKAREQNLAMADTNGLCPPPAAEREAVRHARVDFGGRALEPGCGCCLLRRQRRCVESVRNCQAIIIFLAAQFLHTCISPCQGYHCILP